MAHTNNHPVPQHGHYTMRSFTFDSGETLSAVRQHYITIGKPTGRPVLILHGTLRTSKAFLTPEFVGELFGPGQPLDAAIHYIILPDTIGAGESTKPSDGLRTKFPKYTYNDIVRSQYLLVTHGLGLSHLRLVLGCSMGGMLVWRWGIMYPSFMDALVPMAAQPSAMGGRKWMMRRLLLEMIRQDPAYENGNYTVQPPSLTLAHAFIGLIVDGGYPQYQVLIPTRELADQLVDTKLKQSPIVADANDFLFLWESCRDFDANSDDDLAKISAPLLAIQSEDDSVNPPGTGLEESIGRMANGKLFLVPASATTRGHTTYNLASCWKQPLSEFLESTPCREI